MEGQVVTTPDNPFGAVSSTVTGDWDGQDLTVPFSRIPAIAATELWPGIVPNRTPVFFVAPGGTGKGLAIAKIAAMTTTGEPFPGQVQGREPGQVVMVAPEERPNSAL